MHSSDMKMENARTILLLSQLTSTTPVTPPLVASPRPLDSAHEPEDSALGIVVNVTLQLQYELASAFNNTTDIDALLVDKLGPRRKDMVSAVLLTMVYSLIFLSGVIGNVCTCLVIARTHSMQTTTNYYLFSLAVSDLLLILIGLPPELYSIWEAYPWRLGETFCYLRQTVLESTSYASVLTITAFTVERYLAICHPLLAHKISALSRAVKIIISIWVAALLLAVPYAVHTRLYNGVYIPGTNIPIPDSLVCSIPYHFLEGFMYYMFQVSTFLFFIGPVTVIIILYILIGVALRRSPLNRGSAEDTSYSSIKSSGSNLPHQPRRVVIRMLVAVTVAFIVCWAPFHAQRLMVLYVPKWTPELLAVQSHIFYISGVLYFVSSTVNPILYNVISKRYRAAFKQIIFPCCFHQPGIHHTLSMARHSERYSKAQAMVVLRNGGDVKMVYRQDSADPATMYDTISLGRRRTLSTDGPAYMEVDRRRARVNAENRKISQPIPGSGSKRRHLSSTTSEDSTATKRSLSRQESIPLGIVCCSAKNSKLVATRLNSIKGGSGGDLHDEESVRLLDKDTPKDELIRKENGAVGTTNGGESKSNCKKPLKSCLRHSSNGHVVGHVIENQSLVAEDASASLTQHPVHGSGFEGHSAPTAAFNETLPYYCTSTEPFVISSNGSKPRVARTTSSEQSNGAKSANGHVSFQGVQTKLNMMDV